jgi:hypothetical protein
VVVLSKSQKNIRILEKHHSGNSAQDCDFSSSLNLERARRDWISPVGEKNLGQIRVAVKQGFNTVDSIIFDAALTLNGIETRYKLKEYVS